MEKAGHIKKLAAASLLEIGDAFKKIAIGDEDHKVVTRCRAAKVSIQAYTEVLKLDEHKLTLEFLGVFMQTVTGAMLKTQVYADYLQACESKGFSALTRNVFYSQVESSLPFKMVRKTQGRYIVPIIDVPESE